MTVCERRGARIMPERGGQFILFVRRARSRE